MPKIIIAMSGGVDSAVAAALLLQQGFTVEALTLHLWHSARSEQKGLEVARQVASQLGIPLHVVDSREDFRQQVVQAFISSHIANETPNPCVFCNPALKWAQLLKTATARNADFVATGHYAQITQAPDGKYELWRAKDIVKDQSYVLSGLSQAELSRTILPLGKLSKPEVREIAQKLGLAVSKTPDSQDLCFLDRKDYHNFLVEHASSAVQAGDIRTTDGRILGRHEGLAFYTIGQRKGLPAYIEALYVLDKIAESNTLIVGPASQLGANSLMARPINWISGEAPTFPIRCQVKIRYRANLIPATLHAAGDDGVSVLTDQILRDATPGQSAVFYEGDNVLGGGIIRSQAR